MSKSKADQWTENSDQKTSFPAEKETCRQHKKVHWKKLGSAQIKLMEDKGDKNRQSRKNQRENIKIQFGDA